MNERPASILPPRPPALGPVTVMTLAAVCSGSSAQPSRAQWRRDFVPMQRLYQRDCLDRQLPKYRRTKGGFG